MTDFVYVYPINHATKNNCWLPVKDARRAGYSLIKQHTLNHNIKSLIVKEHTTGLLPLAQPKRSAWHDSYLRIATQFGISAFWDSGSRLFT